jgi:hypothetical protein
MKSRSETQRVTRRIDELIIEAPWWCRSRIDPSHVARLSEALELESSDIPDIMIDRQNRIIDGVHRYEALRTKGVKEVECILIEDDREAWITSIAENSMHGLPYTLSERRAHFAKAWNEGVLKGLKQKELAELYQVSRQTIANWIAELSGKKTASTREVVTEQPTVVPIQTVTRPAPVVEPVAAPLTGKAAATAKETAREERIAPRAEGVAVILFDALCSFVSESVSPEDVAAVWKHRNPTEEVVQVIRISLEKLKVTFDKFLDLV